MSETYKLQIELDRSLAQTEILIRSPGLSPELKSWIESLESGMGRQLLGYREDGQIELLDLAEILRIYTVDGVVYASCGHRRLRLKQRLYQLEEQLAPMGFVRISQSELVNRQQIRRLDVRYSGSMELELRNGERTFVARRYMTALKRSFGL